MTALTMAETAEMLGYSYRTFRREWPVLVVMHNFPNPFRKYTWDRDLVAQWIHDRSRAAANDVEPTSPRGRPDAGAKARAELQAARRG